MTTISAQTKPPGLWRRLSAMLYDALLLIAVMMVFTFALIVPFNGGESLTTDHNGIAAYLYRVLLAALIVVYFGISWTRTGQTLGMKAWRMRAIRADGKPMQWSDVLKRLSAAVLSWAPAGLGYVWIWIDRDKLTWHERLSNTRTVRVNA